ncbi:hypothetical protein [Streptomyces sp. NPDC056160]|uniref:hypothetical protein n=1 Tax=Streptomyces sp. NPDC056160 TaxID=3345731 RepID=UPI0035D9D56C
MRQGPSSPPAHHPRPTGLGHKGRRGRRLRATFSAALIVAAALSLGAGVTARQWWDGESYPVADPSVTADRLDARTREVYAALGLPEAALDDQWLRQGRRTGADCPYTGLSHLADQLKDTPVSVPGVITVSSEWALKDVTHRAGQAALRRARTELRRQDWKVTASTAVNGDVSLLATPPGSDASVYVRTYPHDRLAVSASSGCARVPEGRSVGERGALDLPPQRLPDGLRR